MNEQYEKSLTKLELDKVLAMLSDHAASQAAKERCLAVRTRMRFAIFWTRQARPAPASRSRARRPSADYMMWARRLTAPTAAVASARKNCCVLQLF